ncbi:hypothetical protein BUFA31_21430 [Butyricicoccus faecihominis]|uniref:Uncharacterized protein n=1 Tax=Butyricicoccus faecihominis TaxID=1712515 RepID=A0ABQ1E1X9_9FIRM|nr:hypothetical protein BUFA31_21430 [Butyricicoccus faecihominis]GGM67200.1 hypothetical protein GCM10007040_08000 [Butyricicoccus faecihominis]
MKRENPASPAGAQEEENQGPLLPIQHSENQRTVNCLKGKRESSRDTCAAQLVGLVATDGICEFYLLLNAIPQGAPTLAHRLSSVRTIYPARETTGLPCDYTSANGKKTAADTLRLF